MKLGWDEDAYGGGDVQGLRLELGERAIRLGFHPGYGPRDLGDGAARVALDRLRIEGPGADFEDLDPIARSELLRDLESLRA